MTSIIQGTVTVDSVTGVATGSGCALQVYNTLLAEETAAGSFPDPATPPAESTVTQGTPPNTTIVKTPAWSGTPQAWAAEANSTIIKMKQGLARQAIAISAVIPYIVTNILIRTTVPTNGLAAGVPVAPTNLSGAVI